MRSLLALLVVALLGSVLAAPTPAVAQEPRAGTDVGPSDTTGPSRTQDIGPAVPYAFVRNGVVQANITMTGGAGNNTAGTFEAGAIADLYPRDTDRYEGLDWTETVLSADRVTSAGAADDWNRDGEQLALDDVNVVGDTIVADGCIDASDSVAGCTDDLSISVAYEALAEVPIVKQTITVTNDGAAAVDRTFGYIADPDTNSGGSTDASIAPNGATNPGFVQIPAGGWERNVLYNGALFADGVPAHGIAWFEDEPYALYAGSNFIASAFWDLSVPAGGSAELSWYHIVEYPTDGPDVADAIVQLAADIPQHDDDVIETDERITGRVADVDGAAVAGATVVVRSVGAEEVDRATTRADGTYTLRVPPGTYTLTASKLGHGDGSGSVEVPADDGITEYTVDLELPPGRAHAGDGLVVDGPVRQGQPTDLTIVNDRLAMVVSNGTIDGQLEPVSLGKPLDWAVHGQGDEIDWLHLPWIDEARPTGEDSYQARTVRSEVVEVVDEDDLDRAAIRTTGFYDPDGNGVRDDAISVDVETVFEIETGADHITAESSFTNTGTDPVTLWIGDVIDHDGAGQHSFVPGVGVVTHNDGLDYQPTEPWVAQTGASSGEYGFVYTDLAAADLQVVASGRFVTTQTEVTIPAGGTHTLSRRLVAVDRGDAQEPFEAFRDAYDDHLAELTGVEIELDPGAETLTAGQETTATVVVRNVGEDPITGVDVRLSSAGGGITVLGTALRTIDLAAGESSSQEWTLRADAGGRAQITATVVHDGRERTRTGRIFVNGPGWYWGDNHSHSIHSDGSGTIAENVASARAYGLSWLTATDHNTLSQASDMAAENRDDFVALVGQEITCGDGHSLGYDIGTTNADLIACGTGQSRIDDTNAANGGRGFFYIAHPYYPGLEWDDWGVDGLTGIEVWNGFYPPLHTVNNGAFARWDERLRAGETILGIANSDAHNSGKIGSPHIRACLPQLAADPIVEVQQSGYFYGSNGPDIAMTVDGVPMGGTVHVPATGRTVEVVVTARVDHDVADVLLHVNGDVARTYPGQAPVTGPQTLSHTLDDRTGAVTFTVDVEPGDFLRAEVIAWGDEARDVAQDYRAFGFTNPVFVAEGDPASDTTPLEACTVTVDEPGPEEPYRLEENFDDIPDGELPDGWNPAVGTWRVEDGRLVGGTTTEAIDRLTFGEHRENFRFEATIQFRERANASRWTGLIVDIAPDGTVPWWHAVMRSGSTAGNGLEWATRTASNGWSVPTSSAAPFDVGVGNDVRFAVEVRGNRGILFLDGQEVLRYGGIERSDAGVLGFVLDKAVVEFDDIVVTDISPFEPLTRGSALGTVAMRGNSDAAPENTLAALEQAVRTNARFSIVDARLTADGDPVLMADETVDRTTDGTGPVGSLTTAEVTALDAGSSFSDAYAGQPVPTLAEALDLADALVVDVRDDTAAAAAVAGLLDSRDAGPDTLVLVDDDTTAQAVRDASTEPLQLVLDLRGTTVVAAEVTDGPDDIRAVLLDPSTPADVIAALDDRGVGTILAAETPEEWLVADRNGAAFVASTAPGRLAGVLEGAAQDSLGFADDAGPLVVAHRGWSRVAPENTLAAVASGIAAGADMVEIDAHSTLDDVPYVLHDQTLDRTTDRSGDLATQTAAQVDGADAGSWFSPAYAGQHMPLLAQVLDLIDGSGTTLLLEVKGPEDLLEVSGMVDLIEARGMTDQVVLQSFSTDVLQHARSVSDDLVLGLLTGGFGSDPVAQAQALDVAYFNPSWNSIAGDTSPVADLHAAGVRVVPYTVNSAADWDRMVRAGVDGAITDRAGDMVGWRDAHRLGIEPAVLVSLTAPTVDEGDTATSEASATVSIDRPLSAPVTLTVDTVDDTATAGEDYLALTGLAVTIPAGETQASVPVTITGDDVVEGDETVTITVTAIDGATAEGGLSTASLTIINDDATELSTADVQVIEGDTGTTVALVPLSLTAPADADVVFDVVAVPDTATLADDDYTAPAATGTIPAGTLSGTVELVINGDTGPEEDETVEIHLSNPTVATLGDSVSIVTIRNDDAAVRVADASAVEGDAPETATFEFALELDHPSAVDVEVAVATGATSGPGGATAGEDHTDVDTVVRIPAGHTSATVEVPVIGDDLDEDDETLLLVVTDPVDGDGTTVADPTATGTIVDDDVTIVSVDDAAATEGEDLSFTVRVDADPITAGLQPVPRDASVAWSSADGTATAGEDYTADGGSLQLPSGTTTATLLLPTATDTTDEPDGETVTVTLADAIGVVISDGTGLGTILDPADTPDPGSGGGGSTPPTEPTDPSEPTDPEPTDPSEPQEPGEVGDDEVSRTHGATRVETAVNASRDHWPTASTRTNDLSGRAGGVVLARADAYPDALAGGALAASIDGPLLLTNGDALDPMVEEEIVRLGVEDVIVLGGDAAIGRAVEDRLVELGLDVERIAGASRWDTAALVADRVGLPETGEVVVVLGDHPEAARAWPDALSAGALAASPDRLPVLLTAGSSVPAPTMDALQDLGARRVVLIGGPAVIDSEVEAALVGTVGEVVRLAGRDRYATSVAVARDAFARFADDPDGESIDVVFATGADYPDGLAAGAVAARRGALVLLVPPSDLAGDSPTLAFLRSIADRVDSGVVLGGPGAIDESTRALLEEAIAG